MDSLEALASKTDCEPQLLANTRSLAVKEQLWDDSAKVAVVYLCRILSRVHLRRFSTTFHVDFAPWLPILALNSAHTLTHLDIVINPAVYGNSPCVTSTALPVLDDYGEAFGGLVATRRER
ncbi:hypothetical protein PUNSTDRAFT_133738 [Punctularia strigosozonata HHB-11173 SS5]|uniref:uncharacterized protein n=1 Tax=Punctularia strigosozonata (strain HHB-11173) TaxID=741275 RepID=UPI0004417BF7|nr:uncharacterized protein PUNSTDRAFT_133738 [Punctularia strigosozonata HHB-11173 SS5]EIN09970.1 hypothetical protein PUNSTDRAFT_133738 [Punctularia strigosozonata HHB-11173 SS5]